MKIDIERKDLYCLNKQPNETIKKRLTQMAELGMEEVGVAQFGVKDIMSGLYIEMVWNLTDEKFEDYMKWTKSMILKKSLMPMVQFILEIDWLSTVEFCDTYDLPHPTMEGGVRSAADKFLNLDAIKHKLFVEYAKLLNKKLTVEMFVGNNPLINGFHYVGFNPESKKVKNGKYEITFDQYGFWLEPYDSVDGRRLHKVEDLVSYGFAYNNKL
jgi:hypothetical protein